MPRHKTAGVTRKAGRRAQRKGLGDTRGITRAAAKAAQTTRRRKKAGY
jgi:hypothetical protein